MTTTNQTDDPAAVRDELFKCLSSARRRIVLGLLVEEAPEWTTTAEVAEQLATVEADTGTVPPERIETVHVALAHSTLPILVDAGLVERDRANGTLRLESDSMVEFSSIRRLLTRIESAEEHLPASDLDCIFDALADRRRRTVLSELARRDEPVSRETLARAVVEREGDVASAAAGTERTRNVLTSLTHTHLPLLADADVIEYDQESGFVSYDDHPQVPGEVLEPALRPVTSYVG